MSKKAVAVLGLVVMCFFFVLSFPATLHAKTKSITFGDFSWDSVQIHNRIAGYVLEKAYGYRVSYSFGESLPLLLGMARGDVDVSMEIWSDNIEAWGKYVESGECLDLGPTYPDAGQGWYVPTYVIKGDPERGIEPMAPDLKSIEDLPKYWELFKDPENPDKGRFYNGPTGWVVSSINIKKLQSYGLDKYYQSFEPGSDAALSTAILSAYRKGEPIFFYYWEPTPILGLFDMTKIEEPPYDIKLWNEKNGYRCDFPQSKVHVGASAKLLLKDPFVISFLANYEATIEQTNEALAYMWQNELQPKDAAIWFLKKFPEQWEQWFPISGDPHIDKLKEALDKEIVKE